jgi:hypothetical protein
MLAIVSLRALPLVLGNIKQTTLITHISAIYNRVGKILLSIQTLP